MIRNFFAQEGAKLKVMNFTEKRQYIWEYYKLHIFGTAFILLLAGSLIHNWLNPPPNDYVYIAWMAEPMPTANLNELEDRLSVIITEDPYRYAVTVRSYVLTGEPQMDQALVTRFTALLSIGALHVIMSTEEGVQINAEAGIIGPVHEMLAKLRQAAPAIYNDIAHRLLTITFTSFDDPPVTDTMAINLYGSSLLAELGFITDDLFFTVVINAERPYETAKALELMLYERTG